MVPAPTSRSYGSWITQPRSDQYFFRLKMICWYESIPLCSFQGRRGNQFAFDVVFDLTDQKVAQISGSLAPPVFPRQLCDRFAQHLFGNLSRLNTQLPGFA